MDEKEFYEVKEYLTKELESIENGTARFCTLEELDLALNEIIESYEKQSLEDDQNPGPIELRTI